MPTRLPALAVVALLGLCPLHLGAEDNTAARPVSVQELSLLLRGGYTGAEVLKEVGNRPLLTPIDAAAERALLDAGADANTIAALRDSHRLASTTEADEARQRQAAAEHFKLEAWEAEKARGAQAAHQEVQTKLAARRDEQLKTVGKLLRDKLVVYRDSRLLPYDNAALEGKKLFLLYAAGLDKASHQLTPQMVEFYKKFAPAHPEFELVLVSADRSAYDMELSMQQGAMPWPALAFEQLATQPDLAALGKEAVPRLVLIDGSGTRIADSIENGKVVGAQHVIDVLTGKSAPTAPATAAR